MRLTAAQRTCLTAMHGQGWVNRWWDYPPSTGIVRSAIHDVNQRTIETLLRDGAIDHRLIIGAGQAQYRITEVGREALAK